jgi:hypothetical protein
MSANSVSVIVSDFGEREPSWDRLRSCLGALAEQQGIGRTEVVLCEMPSLFGRVPEDIREMLPNLRIVRCDTTDPHARKTVAVRQASGSIVAFLDADCLPQAGWLQRLTDTFRYYPEAAMVHGRMVGQDGAWQGQVRRFFCGSEAREGAPAQFTATNNAAFRREVYCEYPFPAGSGKDAVRIQTAAMLRAHYVLRSEPAMLVLRDRRGMRQTTGLTAARAEAAIG